MFVKNAEKRNNKLSCVFCASNKNHLIKNLWLLYKVYKIFRQRE